MMLKKKTNNLSYTPDREPYGGFAINKAGDTTGLASTGPHLLVLGGSGAGKSRRVLVPSILTWEGPICAVSAKGDLAEMSATYRQAKGGSMYVLDLTGEVDWDELPDDVIRLVNDPCALLLPDADGSTDDSALDLANLLLQVGSLGMSATGSSGGDSGFWMTLAVRSLAALLQAGGWYPDPETGDQTWGGGISWVLDAAIHYDGLEADNSEDLDTDSPNWDVAQLRASLAGSAHAEDLAASKQLDPKQRDSIGINLRVALSSWQKKAVRGGKGAVPFQPSMLEEPNATLYLVSPASGSAAGAATSVIESLISHWKLNVKRHLPKLALILDELPQCVPLPRLAEHVGLMRSYGVHITAAAQASSQFEPRWGQAGLKILRDIFPAILILIGAPEKEILEQAAWMNPPTEMQVESRDSRGAQANLSASRAETYHASELLPSNRDEGRLLVRGSAGTKVRLADYTDMIK